MAAVSSLGRAWLAVVSVLVGGVIPTGIATGTASTTLTADSVGTTRVRPFRGQMTIYALINQPLMVPEIVTGVALLIVFATVKQATGISINHYLEVDFVGFKALVDELGGITMSFPFPARDVNSGFRVDAGTQILDGEMALAYARSRKYQELHDG